MGHQSKPGVVVVGGGHAGVQCVTALRAMGFTGRLTLLNGEPHAPYDRPSLSKEMLDPSSEPGDFPLRGEAFFKSRDIAVVHARIVRIDRECASVLADDGRAWDFEHLVLATGGRPRSVQVPGAHLRGIVQLRSLDDARSLRAALGAARRIVVIGGGFIGLEVAAAAVGRGLDVEVVEAADRLMGRVVTPEVSRLAADYHRASGVRVRLGEQVREILGCAGAATAVVTSSGVALPADLVVLGVGMLAEDGLAQGSGLQTDGGVGGGARRGAGGPPVR